jgi:hypothetical protein
LFWNLLIYLAKRPVNSNKIFIGAVGLRSGICRNKVIGLPVLEMLYNEADDSDLRNIIKTGIEKIAVPHIERIQDFLKKQGLSYPSMPDRGRLDNQKIALAIMEILRLVLALEHYGFSAVTREDACELVWDIHKDDKKAFDEIIKLNTQKGWLMNPPDV